MEWVLCCCGCGHGYLRHANAHAHDRHHCVNAHGCSVTDDHCAHDHVNWILHDCARAHRHHVNAHGHVEMHKCRPNLRGIQVLTQQTIFRASPEQENKNEFNVNICFGSLDNLKCSQFRTSGGSIARSTASDKMKNEMNSKNRLFTKPANTSART